MTIGEQIVEFVTENPGCDCDAVYANLELASSSAAAAHLTHLVNAGRLCRKGERGSYTYFPGDAPKRSPGRPPKSEDAEPVEHTPVVVTRPSAELQVARAGPPSAELVLHLLIVAGKISPRDVELARELCAS